MSHEGQIYCKQHHRELFQPKVVKDDLALSAADKAKAKAGANYIYKVH